MSSVTRACGKAFTERTVKLCDKHITDAETVSTLNLGISSTSQLLDILMKWNHLFPMLGVYTSSVRL